MVILPNKNALVLRLQDSALVLKVITTAREFVHKGVSLIAMPHRLDETRVLRNLGIRAPSPILHYYTWPRNLRKIKAPLAHQKLTAAFLTLNPRALVLNGMGTGKTLAAAWAADYLLDKGFIDRVIIIAPLSTLDETWGDTIFTNMPHRKSVVLHGSAEKRIRLLQQPAQFYIVNFEGFQIIGDAIPKTWDMSRTLILIDEAARLRNPSTSRFKYIRRFTTLHKIQWLWMMTGTPTPNEPTDAWALAHLVQSPYITKTYTAFRDLVMHKISMYKWVARPNALQIVSQVLQPSIRFTREECLDLPDTLYQTRQVALSAQQTHAYKQMLQHFYAEHQEGGITAANEGVKLMKLIQICCGEVYTDKGQTASLDNTHRITEVKNVIEDAGEKCIVFVPFTNALNAVAQQLGKHWEVAIVDGSTSPAKRRDIFWRFQNSDTPHVIVANPQTMSHGLTLTAASTIIWYAPINSNETYEQANARISRIGQRHVANIVHIEATEVERKAYKRLESKQKLQGLLLDIIEHQQGD